MVKWINRLPWGAVVLMCVTLGLAPFTPPHVIEKLMMLMSGDLVRFIDWFDFLFHGFPWMLLGLKVVVSLKAY